MQKDFQKSYSSNTQEGPKISPKVSFHTLGCRLNFSETGSVANTFAQKGYEIVEFGQDSDVVFINTCTVTDGADSSCRNLIRKAKKQAPNSKLIVAGCYAQMQSNEIQKMPEVDLVLGTSEKYKVLDYLNELEENELDQLIKIDQTNEFWGSYTTSSDFKHTRAFLKIQDGCNYICSFCIIPYARGRSRVISIDQAVKNANELIHQNYKEIVLTGVNIGEYESTSGEKLEHLIQEVLKIPKLERLRLSSVELNTLSDELLNLLQSSKKFQNHFHIPLQSGSDTVLKRMRRKYTVQEYKDRIFQIAEMFPNVGIGADIIAGFPGETEEEFNETFNLLKELPITHFHVFPFSSRKGTTAAKLDNQIDPKTKKERVNTLLKLGEEKLEVLKDKMIDKNFEILIEQKNKQNLLTGHTSNFLKTEIIDSENLDINDYRNSIIKVQIVGKNKNYLLAKVLQ